MASESLEAVAALSAAALAVMAVAGAAGVTGTIELTWPMAAAAAVAYIVGQTVMDSGIAEGRR